MNSLALLRALQVSDTAFPTGAFSHSLGLEASYEAGELANAGDLDRLARLHLSSLATSDGVALRASYGAGLEEIFRVDALLSATKLTRELRAASSSTGRRFLASVVALGVEDETLHALTRAARRRDTWQRGGRARSRRPCARPGSREGGARIPLRERRLACRRGAEAHPPWAGARRRGSCSGSRMPLWRPRRGAPVWRRMICTHSPRRWTFARCCTSASGPGCTSREETPCATTLRLPQGEQRCLKKKDL